MMQSRDVMMQGRDYRISANIELFGITPFLSDITS